MKTAIMMKEGKIKILFPYDSNDVERVRTLNGRRFHNESWNTKFWSAPASIDNLTKLKEWGFQLDEKLSEMLNVPKPPSINALPEVSSIPGLKGKLFPFQAKGVSFIESRKGRALVADEMGLGKTIQALAWLQLHPEARPAIIVCPASLKLNWAREIRNWMPESENNSIQILSGSKVDPSQITTKIIIINYDILIDWFTALQEIQAKALIIDECHYIKNNTAKRTKAVKMLGKGISHILALSGTPIINRPIEIYNALKIVNTQLFPDFWGYARRYCGAKHNGFGWDFNGASHTDELHEKLIKSVMIRRLKKDVLADLPEKIRSFLPIELSNDSEYQLAKDNFIAWIRANRGEAAARKASNAEALVEIETLKQVAIKGKMDQAVEWVRNLIETDGKLVIFATHQATVDRMMAEFKDVAVKVDGSVSGPDRDKAVQQFQTDDKIRLFIGNIRAAGVGITLTAASSVAFLELPWTPGELSQAEDRCHRIGQHDSVTIYYLLAAGTIEEEIAEMLDSKRRVLDSVLDGKATETESLLAKLMKTYDESGPIV